MIVPILLAVLALCNALISGLTQTRGANDKRPTRWGMIAVALSLAICGLSAWKIWQEHESEQLARYVLTDSDIQIRLTASIGEAPSPNLESRTPSAIEIGLVVPNEGGWTCLLESIPGFVYAGPGRGAVTSQRIYLTKSTHKIGNTSFKYVWDLAGKKILILRNPKSAFTGPDGAWKIDAVLSIKGHEFPPKDATANTLEFVLDGLDRSTLQARAAF
jgi:hypothetical protein